ncbi:MAG: DUF3276 family protein [Bacteroidota bacterium]
MDNHNNSRSEVYSTKIRAGKRTYFFDVKETRSQDYYITITESKRRFGGDGYDKHKIFLYKEDFNKFMKCLTETIDYVKTQLLPDYDYEEFDRDPIPLMTPDDDSRNNNNNNNVAAEPSNSYDDDYQEEDEVATTWDD